MNQQINTNQISITSSEFKDAIDQLCKKHNLVEIIETGTYIGQGSTLILAQTNLPVYTLECNPDNANVANYNLQKHTNVKVICGYSLNKSKMQNFILTDRYEFPSHVMVDAINAIDFYLNEIRYNVPEDLLLPLINNDKKQLVFLDSAGGVGYMEYQLFMSLPEQYRKNKVLVLDDINHVKHYRSVLELEQNNNIILTKYSRFCTAEFI